MYLKFLKNINGSILLHRENDFAVIFRNGYGQYYLNGTWYTKKRYYEKLKEINNK